MIWAHSINPVAMTAAIAFMIYAGAAIALFALWVLYSLWLERHNERPDYALRWLRQRLERIAATTLLTGAALFAPDARQALRAHRETRR